MSNYNQPQPVYVQSNLQSGQAPHNNVIYVTVPPSNLTVQPPPQSSNVQINSASHRPMAILEFITVVVIFIMEVIAISVKNEVMVMGTGIWFAPFILVTGVLGYCGGVKKNKCLIISCMVMAIITCCVAIIAMSFYSIELSAVNILLDKGFTFYYYNPPVLTGSARGCAIFIQIKNAIGVLAAVFIFILTIVQSVFCCKDVCSCCHTNTTQSGIIVQPQQQAIVIQHQQMQPVAAVYPQQSYVYPQQQQFSPQPSQVAYPMQGGSYSQPQQAYPMGYGASGVMPPSYQDATAPHIAEDSRKS